MRWHSANIIQRPGVADGRSVRNSAPLVLNRHAARRSEAMRARRIISVLAPALAIIGVLFATGIPPLGIAHATQTTRGMMAVMPHGTLIDAASTVAPGPTTPPPLVEITEGFTSTCDAARISVTIRVTNIG